jgi:2-polyprenyl-3-methyl-5-hydroxy-6-metoxy-1,4-benzoquinol methylase
VQHAAVLDEYAAKQKVFSMPQALAPADGPMMSDDFARAYEQTAHRITGPISLTALNMAGSAGDGTRLLDIAAGAGALSVPAAQRAAYVLAIDIAPGMVKRLVKR